MKFLFQKPLLFPQRPETFSPGIQWQGKFKLRTFTSAILRLLEQIKGIGFSVNMDDYEKRKLGIFNQLNFFQLLTGIVIPVWGLARSHQLPAMAWIVACIPAFVSVLVLALNARREYYLAQIAYFGLYPVATSFVYFWGFNMGVDLSFILYGILSVFFIQNLSQMAFALVLSMASYFGLAVVCKNYTYQLATVNLYFYFFNQLLALGFIFYGLFLIKRENTGYQYSILRQKEALAKNEQLLKQQTEQLLQLNSFKGRLFSIIAHDLKSPIYALRNLFRNMQQYDMPAEEIKSLVPEVFNELTYTTSLMENLLVWARSQMRADSVKPQPVDLPETISEVTRLLRLQADAKHIRVTVSGDNPVIAFADKDMVNLVVRNLLSNAIKYTPENGEIKIAAQRTPLGVELSVRDSGMGIDPEALEKILSNSFYSTKGTAGESGTGLGLMLCREFAIRNGGELLIESLSGKGSLFTVKLPASE
ncbi:MAG TPA: HAMP domain-containing sensor histidine kinase [Puia sp.]|jgi:two-component system sensor histidine kinase/response regulator|nr:HAMP domain-containing sensor histidine kinase [Puia sp.]